MLEVPRPSTLLCGSCPSRPSQAIIGRAGQAQNSVWGLPTWYTILMSACLFFIEGRVNPRPETGVALCMCKFDAAFRKFCFLYIYFWRKLLLFSSIVISKNPMNYWIFIFVCFVVYLLFFIFVLCFLYFLFIFYLYLVILFIDLHLFACFVLFLHICFMLCYIIIFKLNYVTKILLACFIYNQDFLFFFYFKFFVLYGQITNN